MKKKIFVCLFLLILAIYIHAQSLDVNANHIRQNYPEDYEATLKKHAVEEWGNDHQMVVYEINNQADALVELIDEFRSENTQIVFDAIQDWSIEGYRNSNISAFRELRVFEMSQLIKLHCDWQMVKYEYDNQVKASKSVLGDSKKDLDSSALYLHDNYFSDYEATVKRHAQEEWGNDFPMVVYEINNQADALVELVEAFKSEYTSIALNAIINWSIDGFESSNMDTLKELKVFELRQLIRLHCDWQMVKYEYDNQVKAKQSY